MTTQGSPKKSSSPRQLLVVTLLCRKSDGSVLYMEAGKDLVDMLLNFLTLPIGAAMKLIAGNSSVEDMGGIANIYSSVEGMNDSIMYVNKDSLLSPPVAEGLGEADMLKPEVPVQESAKHIFYKCSNHGCLRIVLDVPGQICPVCKFAMSHRLEVVNPSRDSSISSRDSSRDSSRESSRDSSRASIPRASSIPQFKREKEGYVKKNRTYVITNDLQIMPCTTITSIMLLNKLKVDSLADLESVQTIVGRDQIIDLLKASFGSKTALDDVFNCVKKSELDMKPEI